MVWLMAYLAQHAVQIALIGSVAATVYSVENAAVETATVIEKMEGKK
jgi:hypothetical protein